ncbi:MAG: DUF4926 domain-containing protein [Nitrospirota bacterium]
MIREHDRVVLVADVPEQDIKAGDVGTVVHVYSGGAAYEVELMTLTGETVAVLTLSADQVREVRAGEVAHARPREAA